MTLYYVTVTKEYLSSLECKLSDLNEELSLTKDEIANLKVINENLKKKVQLAMDKDFVIEDLKKQRKEFSSEVNNLNQLIKLKESNYSSELKNLQEQSSYRIEELNNMLRIKDNKISSLSDCQNLIEVLKVLKEELKNNLKDLEYEFRKDKYFEYDNYIDNINTIKQSSQNILIKTQQNFSESFYKNIDNNSIKYFQKLFSELFNEVNRFNDLTQELLNKLYSKDKIIKNLQLELDLRESIGDLIMHQQNTLNELYRASKNQSNDLNLKKFVLKDSKRGNFMKMRPKLSSVNPIKMKSDNNTDRKNKESKEIREINTQEAIKINRISLRKSTSDILSFNDETSNQKQNNHSKSIKINVLPKLNLETVSKQTSFDIISSSIRRLENNLISKQETKDLTKYSWYFTLVEQFFDSLEKTENLNEKIKFNDADPDKLGKNTLLEIGKFVKKLHKSIAHKVLPNNSIVKSVEKNLKIKRKNILENFESYLDNKYT